jgi:hypothetical protein
MARLLMMSRRALQPMVVLVVIIVVIIAISIDMPVVGDGSIASMRCLCDYVLFQGMRLAIGETKHVLNLLG